MKKIRYSLIFALITAFALIGCSRATSIQKITTTRGNYNIGFSGEYSREIIMKETNDGFVVKNSTGDTVIDATYVESDMLTVPDTYKIETINDRDYMTYKDTAGYYEYCTYLGDVGADIGLVFVTDDEAEMQYVKLSGKPIEGASSDPRDYFTNILEIGEGNGYTVYTTVEPGSEEDHNRFYFANGKSFVSKYAWTEKDTTLNNVYFINDYTSIECIIATGDKEEITEILSETVDEDVTPMITINKEGRYLQGIKDDMIWLVFMTDGTDGNVYVISILTTDADNAVQTAFDFTDELLASDFTVANKRGEGSVIEVDPEPTGSVTPYEGNEGLAENGYWKDPASFECSYECEFFKSYTNDDYSITFYYEVDDIYKKVKTGEDKYLYGDPSYKLRTTDITIGNTQYWMLESEKNNIYTYYGIDKDDKKFFRLSSSIGEKLTDSELESVLNSFLK